MKRIIVYLMLVASLLAACSGVSRSEFDSARQRWQAAHLTHYRFDLNVACFCGFTDRMPLTIEVKDGGVASMSYKDGAPVPPDQQQWFERYQTIDKLFDFTGESLKTADEIKVEYDAARGFPAKVQVDPHKDAVDEEVALFVTDFQPLP